MLNLVDLAGSERLNEFDSKRDNSNETGHINKSLFILANVINKLAENKHSHIPYRDSKLTRILSNALGGNSLTAIICNVSPAAINHYQTLSTLRFASRAKIIKNKPIINEIKDNSDSNKLYKTQIHKIKEILKEKEEEVREYAKKQLEMQRHLNSANNMNAKLMNEIQFIKKNQDLALSRDNPHSLPKSNSLSPESPEFQELVKELSKEQSKNLSLLKNLEEAAHKIKYWEKVQSERQKQDEFETMIVLIEQVLEGMPRNHQINLQQRANWEDEVGSLLSDYQEDVRLLQDKYIQQL